VLDGERLYFGSGDGTASPLRWPLKATRHLVDRIRPATAAAPAPERQPSSDRRPPHERVARALWALTLAREKTTKLVRADRVRSRGGLVVCDRYPQNQVAGINDGPLLNHWHRSRSPLRRAAARWEQRPYAEADRHPPDLVLRLVVSQSMAQSRRPEHDPTDLAHRRAIVAGLHFDDSSCVVVDLDADLPYDDVLATALAAVAARSRDLDTPRRSIVVELTGIPGAGKTTATDRLQRELEGFGVAADQPVAPIGPDRRWRVPTKATAAVNEIGRHPRDASRVLSAIARTHQRSRADAAKRALNLLAKQHLLRRARRRPGVHLVDEGPLHELCALRYRATVDPDRAVLARALVLPDVVIAIETDPATAATRLEGRASRHSRVQRHADIERQLSRWQSLVTDEIEHWVGAGLSTAATAPNLAEDLVGGSDHMSQHWSSPQGQTHTANTA